MVTAPPPRHRRKVLESSRHTRRAGDDYRLCHVRPPVHRSPHRGRRAPASGCGIDQTRVETTAHTVSRLRLTEPHPHPGPRDPGPTRDRRGPVELVRLRHARATWLAQLRCRASPPGEDRDRDWWGLHHGTHRPTRVPGCPSAQRRARPRLARCPATHRGGTRDQRTHTRRRLVTDLRHRLRHRRHGDLHLTAARIHRSMEHLRPHRAGQTVNSRNGSDVSEAARRAPRCSRNLRVHRIVDHIPVPHAIPP